MTKPGNFRFEMDMRDVFKGMSKLWDLVEKLNRDRSSASADFPGPADGGSGVFGLSVCPGLTGNPFGKVVATPNGPVINADREPLTDIFDENGAVRMTIEMPSVDERTLRVDGHSAMLTANGQGEDHAKRMALPTGVGRQAQTVHVRKGIGEIPVPKTPLGSNV